MQFFVVMHVSFLESCIDFLTKPTSSLVATSIDCFRNYFRKRSFRFHRAFLSENKSAEYFYFKILTSDGSSGELIAAESERTLCSVQRGNIFGGFPQCS